MMIFSPTLSSFSTYCTEFHPMNPLQSLWSVASSSDAACFGGLQSDDDLAGVAPRSTTEAVEAHLVALETMNTHELIALFLSTSSSGSLHDDTDSHSGGASDAWRHIKNLLVIDDTYLRSVMISRLGYVLIKLLIIISKDESVANTIEGYMESMGSSADSKRTIDAAVDAVVDIIRSYALGVMGRAPAPSKDNPLLVLTDDFCCRNAYSEVLVYLIGSSCPCP